MRRLMVLAALLLTCSPAFADTLVLDAFTEALPPSACLPNTHAPIVFWGPYCDGAACPPDQWVTDCDPFWAEQPDLPGVFPGATRFVAISGDLSFSGDAHLDAGAHQLDLHFGTADGSAYSEISYRQVQWDLPLGANGATAFRFTLGGDISPEHPVSILFGMSDNDRGLGAYTELEVTQPGVVVIPFTSMTADGFDFDGIDSIGLEIHDESFTTEGPYPERHVTVGPLSFDLAVPTATRRPSWGSLKSRVGGR